MYTTFAFIRVNSEDKGVLAKLVKAVRTNCNVRYNESRFHWGGKFLWLALPSWKRLKSWPLNWVKCAMLCSLYMKIIKIILPTP
jgi:hypothetical protein